MSDGQFIVIEGIDGSGTTTVTQALTDHLRSRKRAVIATREPSNGPIGALIRQVLTGRVVVPGNFGPRAPGWATMALLFAADRLDHMEAEIGPYLSDGLAVVCDRYDLSSVVYQTATSEGGDADEAARINEWIRTLNRRARRPDLTIVLDVSAEMAAERRRARSLGREEIYEEIELQRRLASLYARAEQMVPGDKIVHVDASRSVEMVVADVVAAVEKG